MKIQVNIISTDNKETINIEDAKDKYNFEYLDSDNAQNKLKVLNNGIDLIRTSSSHSTNLHLIKGDYSYIEILNSEGKVKIESKVLAFEINNDMITLAYLINNEERKIEIRYLGVNYGK